MPFNLAVTASWSAAALLTLCSARTARAESADAVASPEEPAPLAAASAGPKGMLRVRVDAEQRPFAVYFGNGTYPIAECAQSCEFFAWPGTYRIRVRRGDGPNDDATLALRLARPGNYSFVPAQGRLQNAGLLLGVSGPVIGVAGLALTLGGLLSHCDPPAPGQSCETPSSLYVGLGAFAVGSAMTTIGWLLYGHHRAHFRYAEAPPSKAGPRVGFVPTRSGVYLGASLSF